MVSFLGLPMFGLKRKMFKVNKESYLREQGLTKEISGIRLASGLLSCQRIWLDFIGALAEHVDYGCGVIDSIELRSDNTHDGPLIFVKFEDNEINTFNQQSFFKGFFWCVYCSKSSYDRFEGIINAEINRLNIQKAHENSYKAKQTTTHVIYDEYSSLFEKPIKKTSTIFEESLNKTAPAPVLLEQQSESLIETCNNLEEVIKARKIKHLVHFTRADNLRSILTHGLLPRKTLLQKNYSFEHIDGYRFDGRPEASCISISFPNWKLFYTARNKFKDINFNDWVVIEIDPLALLSTKVAFTRENAASYPQRNIPLEELTGKEAFENLFTNEPNMKPREAIKLPIQFPTNPQSEVLFFGKIDTKFFQSVSFLGKGVANRYNIDGLSEEYTNIDFRIDGTYFNSRCDYKYWQKPR